MKATTQKKLDKVKSLRLPANVREAVNKIEKNLGSDSADVRNKAEASLDKVVMKLREVAKKKVEAQKSATPTAAKRVLSDLEKLIASDPELADFNSPRKASGGGRSDAKIDAERKAVAPGRRTSKKGWKNQYGTSKGGRVYYENRENRSDRRAPGFVKGKPYLQDGGYVHPMEGEEGYIVLTHTKSGATKIRGKYKSLDQAMMAATMLRDVAKNDVMIKDHKDNIVYSNHKMENGGSVPKPKYSIVFMDNDGVERNEVYYDNEWDEAVEHYETLKMNFGMNYQAPKVYLVDYQNGEILMGEEFAKGGRLEVISDEDKAKHFYFYQRYPKAIGSFGWITDKTYGEGILYPLDDVDQDFYSHLKLKSGERLFRYKTDRMKDYFFPLIKINMDRGMLYFLEDSEDDKNPKFSSRGVKFDYMKFDKNHMAKGGNVYSSDEAYEICIYKNGKEVEKFTTRARSKAEAREYYEDWKEDKMKKIYGDNIEVEIKLAPSKMAQGGYMAKGGTTMNWKLPTMGKPTKKIKYEIVEQLVGYTPKGEDYEYVNYFKRVNSDEPVPQKDFEKFVDAWHEKLSGNAGDKAKYDALKKELEKELGRRTVEDMEDYIERTHNADKMQYRYAQGGSVADDSKIMRAAKSYADNPNWTNEKLLKEYRASKFDLREFEMGYLKPSKVIGTGYKSSAIAKKLAKNFLEERIEIFKTALEMRGVMAKGGYMAKGGKIQSFRILPFKSWKVGDEDYLDAENSQSFRIEGTYSEAEKAAQEYVKTNSPRIKFAQITLLHPSGNPLKNKNISNVNIDNVFKYANGGSIGFESLSKKVAKRYEGKSVPKKYQKDYGKTYDKEEAKEVGDKVAAKVYRQQQGKMAKGGKVGGNGRLFKHAKATRKEGESWQDAIKRAVKELA